MNNETEKPPLPPHPPFLPPLPPGPPPNGQTPHSPRRKPSSDVGFNEDIILMPPPPIPRPRIPSQTKILTTREIITHFAANSALLNASPAEAEQVITPDYFEEEDDPTFVALNVVEASYTFDEDYEDFINDRVDAVLQSIRRRSSNLPVVFTSAFERTRARYIQCMQNVIKYRERNMSQPWYSWKDIMSIITMNSALAVQVMKLPGQRNIYSSLIDWCVYLFKSWHMEVWVENKGGWEAVLEDLEADKVDEMVQVVFHPTHSPEPCPSTPQSTLSPHLPTTLSTLSPSPPTSPSASSSNSSKVGNSTGQRIQPSM